VRIAAHGLASVGNSIGLILVLDSGGLYSAQVNLRKTADSGNPVKFRFYLRGASIVDYPTEGSITLDQWYKIGIKYDNTNLLYDFSVDDVSYAASSMVSGNNSTRIKLGDNDGAFTLTAYIDSLYLDTAEYYSGEAEPDLSVSVFEGGIVYI
jgi:hypothetical protein